MGVISLATLHIALILDDLMKVVVRFFNFMNTTINEQG